MDKVIVTQDFLFEYLTQHNVNMKRLSELMGVSNAIVMFCFRHDLNRHGKPQKFSASNIEKLNNALPQLAQQIRGAVMTFTSDQTYDRDMVPYVNALQRWFKLGGFLQRVLGWSLSKKEAVLCSPAAKSYGNITADHVARINAEILAVSGMLGGIQVAANEDV